MRPIDADATLEEAEKEIQLFLKSKDSADAKTQDEVRKIQIALYQLVGSAQTLEPKKGKWTDDKCSICNTKRPIERIMRNGNEVWHYEGSVNFCPNCGAKMERSEE